MLTTTRPTTTQKQLPHKSTTHREEYFHFKLNDNSEYSHITVFFREEQDSGGKPVGWYASWAACSARDEFNRARGRTIARRHYFQQSRFVGVGKESPTYDSAHKLVDSLPGLPEGYASRCTYHLGE